MQIKPLHLVLALLAAACDAPEEAPPPLPAADAAVAPADAVALRLSLVDRTSGLPEGPQGPFRLIAEDTRSQARIEHRIAGRIDDWPHSATLDPLPAGTWRLTVFADRDDDGAHDGCPFPPEPGHAELADTLDNVWGVVEVQGGREAEVVVPLVRHICGPGDAETGIEGRLVRPDDPALDGVPVRAMLVPEGDAVPRNAHDEAPRPRALRFPLFPEGAARGDSPFRVGELIPGRYRLHIFTDHDGDGTPSPCAGDMPGGGDRFVAEIDGIDITAGEFTGLDRPITLDAAPCPAALTGISGAIMVPDAAPEGALRVEVTSSEGGPPVAAAALAETLRGRAMPHPFTVSGLPAGTWRVRIYLDADGDRRYSPCAGMPSTMGFDHIVASLEDVTIAPGELLPLGLVALDDTPCPVTAGIAGHVDIDVEGGPLSSGRPVRMHLDSLDGGEPVALQLFSDHVDRDLTDGRFGRRIPAGRYRARAYLDSDRDGQLGPCDVDPYGDRAQSAPFDIEVGADTLVELPAIDVIGLECPIPPAALAPMVQLDGLDSLDPVPDALLFDIREAGGWSTMHAIALGPPGPDPIPVDPIELVPGDYTVTAFVDGDGDGELDTCDESTPDPYQARVSLTLDAGQPIARPSLRPVACDR